ncbi:MAG: methyltransferase domain-containing protein [Leptospiraceae bacterium]|nr:methyltransferase domain-containing protein [Leptospiraceae bacterium]
MVDWRCPKCGKEPETKNGFLRFASDIEEGDLHYPQEVYDKLYSLEESNFWFNYRNSILVSQLKKYKASLTNFLEIGCGTGFVISEMERKFPNAKTYGSEIHTEGLVLTGKRVMKSELMQMDARNIPFREEFDAIGAFDVIEHIEDDRTVLKEINLSLKKGGILLLTVPQHQFLWSQTDIDAGHQRRYARKELIEKVLEADFKILRVSSFISLLFPFMMLSRLVKKKSEANPIFAELEINPVLNRFFKLICSKEGFLIYSKVSFPFWGSIFLIGEKQ